MSGKKTKHPVFCGKLLYSIIILICYLIGRKLPLYGINVSIYVNQSIDAQVLLMQMISGDFYRSSLFALGISPYILSSLIIQAILAFVSSEKRRRISPVRIHRMQMCIMLMMAAMQAVFHLKDLNFAVVSGWERTLSETVAVIEMITGAFVILWLAGRNKRYGIGGQTLLIYVNILDGLRMTMQRHHIRELIIPLFVSFIMVIVVLVMENAQMQIPVMRISIHNIYADTNYLAIKLNPIGVMPVMFASSFFMLPQMLVQGLAYLLPDNAGLRWWQDNLVLTRLPGIGVYIFVLYILTISFSLIFLRPGDLAEQFLKSGDSIANLHSGKDTRKYLTGEILKISFFSATVMGICIGIPMLLQLAGTIESSLVMLPSSVMMMTGIWSNLYQEVIAICNYDAYQPFI